MTTEHKIIGGIILLTLAIMSGGIWWSSKGAEERKEQLSRPMMGEKMPDLGAVRIRRTDQIRRLLAHIGLARPDRGLKQKLSPMNLCFIAWNTARRSSGIKKD